MNIVTNPGLLWMYEGQPGHITGEVPRQLAHPPGWTVTAEISSGDTPPSTWNKPYGLELKLSFIAGSITVDQTITVPAGAWWIEVATFNHVVWGDDDYALSWVVGFAGHASDPIWVQREKTAQPFKVRLVVPEATTGQLTVTLRSKWGDGDGGMQLHRVDVVQVSRNGHAQRGEIVLPGKPTPPPTVPEVPEDTPLPAPDRLTVLEAEVAALRAELAALKAGLRLAAG